MTKQEIKEIKTLIEQLKEEIKSAENTPYIFNKTQHEGNKYMLNYYENILKNA